MSVETITLRLPRLYPKQHAAVFDAHRYSIVAASTKAGKTVACICWLLAQAWEHGKDGRNYWWVAPIYPQAKIAFRRMCRMLARTDPGKTAWDANESELFIRLKVNGSFLWFKGADNTDSLYAEDVYAAVIDEATRVKEEAWHAIRSTITKTRGPVRIIGNVKGRKNWAYQLGLKAQAGDPNMGYHKLTAYDAVEGGVLDAEEIESAKRELPEAVFRELYLAEPSDDGANPFGIKAIRGCVGTLSELAPVGYGVDLAKSHDWCVLVGLDASGAVCRLDRWQGPWGETLKKLTAAIGDTPALIDSTGVGDPIVEELQRILPNVEGYKFTSQSKQQLMEGLASAIQQQEITYPDGWLVGELESFEFEYTRTGVRYTAPEGLHDDGVCALALARRRCTIVVPQFEFSIGGVDGRVNRMDDITDSDIGWSTL